MPASLSETPESFDLSAPPGPYQLPPRDKRVPLLAIDAAGAELGLALRDAQGQQWLRLIPGPRGQAERLLPAIAELLAVAGLRAGDLRLIGAAVGPGSFTGIRLGLAVAEGLSFAAGVPLVGIDNFTLAAAATLPVSGLADGQSRAVLLDSKRADLFLRRFDASLVPAGPGMIVPLDGLTAHLSRGDLLCGDAAGIVPDAGAWSLASARRSPVEALADLLGTEQAESFLIAPRPLYLRAPDAVPAVAGGRLRP